MQLLEENRAGLSGITKSVLALGHTLQVHGLGNPKLDRHPLGFEPLLESRCLGWAAWPSGPAERTVLGPVKPEPGPVSEPKGFTAWPKPEQSKECEILGFVRMTPAVSPSLDFLTGAGLDEGQLQ